jgi:hypothetical protein
MRGVKLMGNCSKLSISHLLLCFRLREAQEILAWKARPHRILERINKY